MLARNKRVETGPGITGNGVPAKARLDGLYPAQPLQSELFRDEIRIYRRGATNPPKSPLKSRSSLRQALRHGTDMIRKICLATIMLALAAATLPLHAEHRRAVSLDAHGYLDALIAQRAAAYNVPESLIRRVIRRESGGNPRAVHAGNYGLMQIRLGTARAMGYRGAAAGLLDAETNMTYAVQYLAGAYRAAGGNADRAVHYYAAGYHVAARHHGRRHKKRSHTTLAITEPLISPYK
jgi:soluble lytic murein transglycosylase-like protein